MTEMKKWPLLLLMVAALSSCKMGDQKDAEGISPEAAQKALKDSANYTQITWLDSTYLTWAKITEGKQVEVAFRFKNTGTKNLIITHVAASCGCTIPEKPGKAICSGRNRRDQG